MSEERQLNFINNLNNRVRKRYYVDDNSEITDCPLEENMQIYSINDDQLYQIELSDYEEQLSGQIISFQGRNNTEIKDLTLDIEPIQEGSGDPHPEQYTTISGDIVTFNSPVTSVLKKLDINIEPVQDLHGYDNPWPAGGGVNKLKTTDITAGKTAFGLTSAISGEYVRFTGTCSSGGSHTWKFATIDSDQRTLVAGLNLKGFVMAGGSGLSITAISYNDSDYTLSINLGGLVTNTVYDFSVGIVAYSGSTAPTAWSPYSNICPISGWTGANIYDEASYDAQANPKLTLSWQSEAGTVYGSNAEYIGDDTWKLTSDMAYGQVTSTYLSGLSSTYIGYISTTSIFDYGPAVWVRNLFNSSGAKSRVAGGIKAICNAFVVSYNNTSFHSTQNRCAFKVDGVTINSVETFISAVQTMEQNGGGLYLAYELATPIEYTITSAELFTLLKGENNVWADTGSTIVEYLSQEANIRPISGWTGCNVWRTGKNLCDPSKLDDSSNNFIWGYRGTGFLFKANQTYTLSVTSTLNVSSIRIVSVDEATVLAQAGSGLKYATYTPTTDTYGVIRLWATGLSLYGTSVQLELGSTATSYEEYHGTALTLSWQSEAGTVYGEDVQYIGDDQWKVSSAYKSILLDETAWSGDPGEGVLTSADPVLTGRYKSADSGSTARIIYGLSNYYPTKTGGYFNNSKLRTNGVSSDKLQIIDYKTDFGVSTYQAFLDIMEATPLQIVYRLATPIEYTITSAELFNLLKGENNVWADCGDITITISDKGLSTFELAP